MAGQIIVQVSKGWNNQTLVELVRAPNIPADDVGIMPFTCDSSQLPSWTQPDAVLRHGQALWSGLLSSHDRIRDALTHAMTLPKNDACPIYLQLKALPSAEVFCWEALCDAGGRFLSLDQRWQVGRIATSPQLAARRAVEIDGPVRMLVIMAALGRDAKPEWNGLYSAVKAAREAGLDLQLRVATGHEELQDEIFALAETDKKLTLFALKTGMDLLIEAENYRPHLVHVFSHGSTAFSQPRLELCTLNDASSIELTLEDLSGNPAITDSWLVVLNCCEGGAASKDMHSLAHDLVARGANAVIGMKEAVDQIDAHEFTTRLYPSVLRKLCKVLEGLTAGKEAVLDWAEALWAPRYALHERYRNEQTARQWTQPVLYVQPELLRVRRGTVMDAGQRAHQQTIDELLALLPEDKRAQFLAELELVRAERD